MLNGSNFIDWEDELLLTLGCLNLDTAIMESKPAKLTENSSQAERASYEKWIKASCLSFMIIKRSISKNTPSSIPDNENAKAYLEYVKQPFHASDKTLAAILIAKLS